MQMNREFLSNLVFLVVVNLLIKPFYLFGIERTVQNTVEQADYGHYFALFNLAYLLQIVNDLGIHYFNNQRIAKRRELLQKYFPNMLLIKAALGLLFLIAVAITAKVLGYPAASLALLLVIAVNQILNSLVLFLRSNLSGLGWYRQDSLMSISDKLFMIFVLGILLWTPGIRPYFKIEWFAYAQTLSLGLTALACWYLLKGRIPQLHFRWQPKLLIITLRYSYPYALAVFLMTAYTRLDGVMIERMLPDGAHQAAIYASAYRLLDASNMIGFLFAGLLLPMFARLLKDIQALRELTLFSFQLIWTFSLSLAIASWFYQAEVMTLLYERGNAYSGQVLGYLMLTFTAMCGGYVFGTLIAAEGRMRYMNYIYAASLVLNASLNLWLIPRYKAQGAAIATLITQYLVFIGQILLSRRQLGLHLPLNWMLRIFAFTLLSCFLAWTIFQVLPIFWFVKFLLTALATVLCAFLIRVIIPSQLISWMKPEPTSAGETD